ncbi:hypothetical protein ACIA8O_22540 [Kitasatospora sp. NPDC051853]|uniref:hypothetical protein n=1 Tax=Kitasatospora sp. NPDC051853 TaxID=3364058 RepID=UPI0037B0CE90
MEQAGREIRAALESADGGAVRSLRILGAALAWVCAELRELEPGPDGTTALRALYALDDALTAGADLDGAVQLLLEAARAGAGARRGLTELTEDLARAHRELKAERAAREDFAARESELTQRLAELSELRLQVAELRRLERIVDALDGLAGQQEAVTARLLLLRGKDTGVEDALRTSADRLLRLSEAQLAALAPQTRQTLERAETADRELADARRKSAADEARLAELRDRLDAVRARRGEQLVAIRLHARADAELARALAGPSEPGATADGARSALEQVEALVESLDRRLAAIDATLGSLLEQRDRAEEHDRDALSWADG